MKAVVYEQYGSPEVLEIRDVAVPEVKDGEVLVRVRAGGVNPADWHFMRGDPFVARLMMGGLRKPRKPTVMGSDMSGVVEEVGKSVTRFQPGDEVFGEVGFGGFAELVAFSAEKLERKPENLSFEEAAAVPLPAMTALIGIRDVGNVQPGQKVLVNGASGGVGTDAVQIAKALGAEVTGVCSGKNAGLVRSLGADHVIDYTKEDFSAGGVKYDVILDTVGNRSLGECRRVLSSKGVLGATGGGGGKILGPLAQHIKAMAMSPFVSQKLSPVNDKPNKDLATLKELIEDGKITPVMDRTYQLDETPDAVRYVESGHVRGKVTIAVGG